MADPRAILGAVNNADWYAAMFDVHGLRYDQDELGFRAIDRPPAYHGRLTWVDPNQEEAIRDRIRADIDLPGMAVKDGYDTLDLEDLGLRDGFSATWIYRDKAPTGDTKGWERIATEETLQSWEQAWAADGSPVEIRHFPEAILSRPDMALWGRKQSGQFVAGFIANTSQNCVGISNAFGTDVFEPAAILAHGFAQGLPVVGYERGDDLRAALTAGFEAVGPLRVWFR